MRPDETDEERQEKLPQDNARPFDADTPDQGVETRPETDSNVDSTEVYQEGLAASTNTDQPNGTHEPPASNGTVDAPAPDQTTTDAGKYESDAADTPGNKNNAEDDSL
jgi:hypothetical protein